MSSRSLNVVIWPALGRVGTYATGVGKHILRMSVGLAATPGWQVRMLFTSDLWEQDLRRSDPSEMDRIPGIRLPFRRAVGELLWRTLKAPRIDRWLGECDWIYCPRELYVPSRRAKRAVTVHDVYSMEPCSLGLPTSARRALQRRALRRALKEAGLILAVSEFTKSRLAAIFDVDPAKVHVVGNGVDDGFFRMYELDPAEVSPLGEAPYVLAVGGVTRKKGALHLIAAATALAKTRPDVRMIVTGPVADEYQREVRALGNLQCISRGFPDGQMQRLVRGARATLVLSEYEGFGIPALEAMAAGVPVVAARRAALPETVGDAAVLVEPQDTRLVSDAVASLMDDSRGRDELISRGRARAAGFRWQQCVQRLRDSLQAAGSLV